MAQFDALQNDAPTDHPAAEPHADSAMQSRATISGPETVHFLFHAPQGSVVALGGLDGATLRGLVENTEHLPDGRRVLFARLRAARSIEACVEQMAVALAETATRLWPVWFTDVSFAICRNDALGRHAAGVIAREAATRVSGINCAWAEAAAHLALAGHLPRVAGTLPAIELTQLSAAVSRRGLVFVVDVSTATDAPDALAHALEWVAQHSCAPVVALFAELPPLDSPFDRILYGARCVVTDPESTGPAAGGESPGLSTWLTPWRGAPHPLSEIEQRLAAMLAGDAELSELFRFNWFVDTVRGSRPKVDLVWIDGRLVVELDGYGDHGTRRAFIGDRHRDYELMLSGYIVLRLANDEVLQDFGRAVEKIRDVVRLRRAQMKLEA
jgi:very-short-patch-repair endonuclease